jgi:flagellar hook-associated protein 3 FlgL
MRVTNALVSRSITSRLLESQRRLAESQDRVATGKRVQKMSDDPTAGSSIMQASGSLRAIEQYQRNVQGVVSRLDSEDAMLGQLTDLMTRAKELSAATIGATVGAPGRKAAALEVRGLLAQAVLVGNTQIGGEYLFSGTNSDGRPPFTAATTLPNGTRVFVPTDVPPAPDPLPDPPPPADPVPRLPTGERRVEIAAGSTIFGAHDGKTVFLDTGLLAAFEDLAIAMENDSPADMRLATSALDGAFDGVQALLGEVGARQNQVDAVLGGLVALEGTLTEQKSSLSEVDMEAAITEMLQRQTAYQAAMMASSKVLGLSLTDYIR